MTGTINVALIGSKFMGRAHSNAWLNVPRFFDVDPRPVMHTIVGRNAGRARAFAARWGWQIATTDWRAAITAPEIGLVDIGTPNDVHAEQCDRGARGRQARRLREAAGGHARRRRGDGGRGREGPTARRSSGTTTAACPPSRLRTSSPGRGARADLPRSRVLPPELGRARARRCSGGSRTKSPARAPTATSTRTSSTWPASSPARRSCRSRGRSSNVHHRARAPGRGRRRDRRSGAGSDRPGRRQHRRRRRDVPRPPQRRRAGVVRGDPPRDRQPQRQPLRDQRRPGLAALRLRGHELPRLLRRDRRRRDGGLDDDQGHARRRPSLRRRLVARQPRARLRARLR